MLDDVLSLGSNLIDGVLMAPRKFIGGITGDYEKNWVSYDTLTTFTNTIRTDTAQDLNREFGTDAAGFIYNTVMSIGDMVVAYVASQGLSYIAGAATAASSASSAANTINTAKTAQDITKFIMI